MIQLLLEPNVPKAVDYIEDVRRYHRGAALDRVQKIVLYCGIALRSRDASIVSCTDEAERQRVRDGFCAKKLGMGPESAEEAINTVCQTMKGDRHKRRVTFYYLLAKNAGLIEML
jgi:hypothetical protein